MFLPNRLKSLPLDGLEALWSRWIPKHSQRQRIGPFASSGPPWTNSLLEVVEFPPIPSPYESPDYGTGQGNEGTRKRSFRIPRTAAPASCHSIRNRCTCSRRLSAIRVSPSADSDTCIADALSSSTEAEPSSAAAALSWESAVRCPTLSSTK